jgi:hypothetical protein
MPKEFQKSFTKWMKSSCEMTHGDIIAIDGKTLKGSFKKKNRSNRSDSIHTVSAFA